MVVEIFGKVLREIRAENHISQEKLAEYCDLDRTYISLLERGLRLFAALRIRTELTSFSFAVSFY